jgi:hypothetical protein
MIVSKKKAIHIHKLSLLNSQQNEVLYTSASDSKKFILNRLKHAVWDSEEAINMKDLNLAVVNPHAICCWISCLKTLQTLGM